MDENTALQSDCLGLNPRTHNSCVTLGRLLNLSVPHIYQIEIVRIYKVATLIASFLEAPGSLEQERPGSAGSIAFPFQVAALFVTQDVPVKWESGLFFCDHCDKLPQTQQQPYRSPGLRSDGRSGTSVPSAVPHV